MKIIFALAVFSLNVAPANAENWKKLDPAHDDRMEIDLDTIVRSESMASVMARSGNLGALRVFFDCKGRLGAGPSSIVDKVADMVCKTK